MYFVFADDARQARNTWSTTAIYCSVSDDYKNRILEKALAGMFRRRGAEGKP